MGNAVSVELVRKLWLASGHTASGLCKIKATDYNAFLEYTSSRKTSSFSLINMYEVSIVVLLIASDRNYSKWERQDLWPDQAPGLVRKTFK